MLFREQSGKIPIASTRSQWDAATSRAVRSSCRGSYNRRVAKVAHVWAAHLDTPGAGNVCEDARLRGPADLRHDQIEGQAGWTVGLAFSSLAQLALRLRSVRIFGHTTVVSPGKIRRLAINAHGAPGALWVNGDNRQNSALRLDTLSVHEQALSTIHEMTHEGGAIYFMGCNVAAGGDGAELLRLLSEDLLRGRFVVGYRHRGYMAPGGISMGRGRISRDDFCVEPGMRDGDRIGSSGEDRDGSHRNWRSLERLPWATARSRSAVAAFQGHIVGSQQMPSDRMPSWY